MRFTVLILILLVYPSSSYGAGEWEVHKQKGYPFQDNFFKQANPKQNADVGQDPFKCAIDMSELESSEILRCRQLFQGGSNLNDLLMYDLASARKFCQYNCQKLLPDLFVRLIRDCAFPIPSDMPEFVGKMCVVNPAGETCLESWLSLANTTSSDYANCVKYFNPNSACPDSCKKAEEWVVSNIGCCYRLLYDFQNAQGLNLVPFLDEQAWDSCNSKEPASC